MVEATRRDAPDKFYIAATAQVMERRARILKAADTFSVFDIKGDLAAAEHAAEGIYHEDTRYLSELKLLIAGGNFLLLGSTVPEWHAAPAETQTPSVSMARTIRSA